MNWLAKAVALMLVALWLPATSHCKLEMLAGFEFLPCGPHQNQEAPSHQGDDCHKDGCMIVESGLYKMEETDTKAWPPSSWSALLPSSQADVSASMRGTLRRAGPAPPQSAPPWILLLLAAHPPRAPSPLP